MTKVLEAHPYVQQAPLLWRTVRTKRSKNPLGRLLVDQAMEETSNKDTPTPGGMKRFSLMLVQQVDTTTLLNILAHFSTN